MILHISLSNIQGRIDKMGRDVENILCISYRPTDSLSNYTSLHYPAIKLLGCVYIKFKDWPEENRFYRPWNLFYVVLKRQLLHCVIQWEHLVVNIWVLDCIILYNILQVLSTRIETILFQENDEVFTWLLLHTWVRWLWRGSCLAIFSAIFVGVSTRKRPELERISDQL